MVNEKIFSYKFNSFSIMAIHKYNFSERFLVELNKILLKKITFSAYYQIFN